MPKMYNFGMVFVILLVKVKHKSGIMRKSTIIALANVLNVLILICLIVDGFICFFGSKELVEQILPSTVGLLCFLGADMLLKEISALTNDDEVIDFDEDE